MRRATSTRHPRSALGLDPRDRGSRVQPTQAEPKRAEARIPATSAGMTVRVNNNVGMSNRNGSEFPANHTNESPDRKSLAPRVETPITVMMAGTCPSTVSVTPPSMASSVLRTAAIFDTP